MTFLCLLGNHARPRPLLCSSALQQAQPTEADKFDFWKLTLREKTSYIRNNITVEPMLALYTIPSVLASLATQNLNLEKACRVNLGYSDDVCDALTARQTANYTLEEAEVRSQACNSDFKKKKKRR